MFVVVVVFVLTVLAVLVGVGDVVFVAGVFVVVFVGGAVVGVGFGIGATGVVGGVAVVDDAAVVEVHVLAVGVAGDVVGFVVPLAVGVVFVGVVFAAGVVVVLPELRLFAENVRL